MSVPASVWQQGFYMQGEAHSLLGIYCKTFRAVASLSLPGGQDRMISSIFPHFPVASLIFPQFFFIFFLILGFRVGGSPTWEGPGYATEDLYQKLHQLRV